MTDAAASGPAGPPASGRTSHSATASTATNPADKTPAWPERATRGSTLRSLDAAHAPKMGGPADVAAGPSVRRATAAPGYGQCVSGIGSSAPSTAPRSPTVASGP